jgi:signal transduction histidine kinase
LVKGYAATLVESRRRLTDEEQTEFLTTIVEEADHLSAQIDQLLKMAALDALGLEPHPGRIVVSEWLSGLVRRFPPPDRRRLRIAEDAGQDIAMWGDADQLRDATVNLVQNALKYTREAVEVSARLEAGSVVIAVRDYGPGLAEADLGRIFEPFYRASRGVAPSVAGTGLGLSIARSIVLAHHGEIGAENAPGGGLSVSIRLSGAEPVHPDHGSAAREQSS